MNAPQRTRAEDLVTGRWDDVLKRAGLPASMMHTKHQPCPMCRAGVDRFKFYDFDTGKNWCNVCGMGHGWRVLMAHLGLDFKGACDWVREAYGFNGGNAKPVPYEPPPKRQVQPEPSFADLITNYRMHWREARRIVEGSPAWQYVNFRAPALEEVPPTLREVSDLPLYVDASEEEARRTGRHKTLLGRFDAMLAAVQGEDGQIVNLQRYYLKGGRLLSTVSDVENAKKAWGRFATSGGYAVRLAPAAAEMAIAEGVAGGLVIQSRDSIPVWCTLSAGGMRKFNFGPEFDHVRHVIIYADNDAPDRNGRRAGNEAAKELQNRLIAQGRRVTLMQPASTRWDFADIYTGKAKRPQAA